ncbi:MAG TPA: mechanosensitive ion channel [Thiobacillus sp.]|nr:MAG: mechanosensitive ion channel protein MscS [Hydrogenophilales bacterium 16-64-40]OZA34067.1 MAG: mechanosensitive ion channel protein MscS [Hydrogenophilales bacterium 17-64-65]HQS82612.1 mechanosensitive ion channel [Thiobacillus sp.]HQT33664.1 mechanosensitive ion channel [Thiobacillus sp.]
MSLALPVEFQTLLDSGRALIGDLGFWWELGVLLLAAAGALLVHRTLSQSLVARAEDGAEYTVRHLALKTLQRILFPISMLLGVLAGRALLLHFGYTVNLLNLAVPLLVSLATICISIYFLRKTFRPGPAVKAWENLIATSVWLVVALHLLGWLPAVLEGLDGMAMKVGSSRISALATIKLLLAVALLWLLAQWLGRVIENRINRTEFANAGMQVALVKLSKFVLLVLVFLLALDAVGIDLTALTVFGGALGVGLGFGLQRIASNFISGFIVLFDRSIRPGDVITIDNKLGWVQELHARYVVVQDRDGVERLIPNEMLITNEVINWSYSNRNVRLKIPVSISYDNDPEQALALLAEAARANPRILADPVPTTRLMAFGDSGIELELRVWIQDPEAGLGSVRSDINLAIWRAFKDAGIVIPYPQRDLHIRSGLAALMP